MQPVVQQQRDPGKSWQHRHQQQTPLLAISTSLIGLANVDEVKISSRKGKLRYISGRILCNEKTRLCEIRRV